MLNLPEALSEGDIKEQEISKGKYNENMLSCTAHKLNIPSFYTQRTKSKGEAQASWLETQHDGAPINNHHQLSEGWGQWLHHHKREKALSSFGNQI